MHIIIQAGGRGTRLEQLTKNKPKALVSVDNRPIIFHLFSHFSDATFHIVADYKAQVLESYLTCFANGGGVLYDIIKPSESGTIAGLKVALDSINDDESFMIIWCDLILPRHFTLPKAKGNYIGISESFECRWSYENGVFKKTPSTQFGVAGLFIFESKHILKNIPTSGAFVPWIQKQNIAFKTLSLQGTKEIGTLLSYAETLPKKHTRPFNQVHFIDDRVIKTSRDAQGEAIMCDEIAWYEYVKERDFAHIPQILSLAPLTLKKVQGRNLYEYDCLTKSQKREILISVINALKALHKLSPKIRADIKDCEETYINKTFERLEQVRSLVPFANDEFIKINGHYYHNIFFAKDAFINAIKSIYPAHFVPIHGDCTFSNIMFDTFNHKAIFIDPRGYFGKSKIYGDSDYDWAKLYYSLKGDYDQFNHKKFTLDIGEKSIEFALKPNNWADMEEIFFENLHSVSKYKIKLLHALIWLSLTTYAWDDYDCICGAFYNGIVHLGEVL